MNNHYLSRNSYDQYDDDNPFQPIILYYDIPKSEAEKDSGKLSDVVIYNTWYNNKDEKMMTLSFDHGEDINVNTIIELPTFRA